ncbi:electron transporter subunit RnfC [Canicola haemoglobinophilus]|uniref:Ion-translocating oxidoreductase complex subunit C n=1 Tax=Canicola haemoglobinophilus TaxID=733 RepID=A0AB38H865_9PAST|nr:electron transport complex subunit RsxC [Canicola haemoglobinophilus]STO53787.1 electron transporter subunit RnfC [Canicola haemoglobinophilus]STO68320.1 electron transporter subunit RnfC [Canicola haemoglobinophilus]
MTQHLDILTNYNSGKLWDFYGGIHPPEMKSQSNQNPIQNLPLANRFYIPIKQHAGSAGNILVKVGDKVLKGQALTIGSGLKALPVHASTSGIVKNIAPYVAAHPSGLSEISIEIEADGLNQWREKQPVEDFLSLSREQLIDKIYQAGIAGLGGAVFPAAAKIQSAENKVKLLVINGAECEPYITCDDRLMRDYSEEIIEGIRILRYILSPEKVVIAVEDNKPEAIEALQQGLHGANDIDIRVIPTKYPSGAAKQLIQILTGVEVPSGQRSSSIGVLMHNVGTAFAIKRAIIDDEPLIERVVTLTGDKIAQKGNYWVPFGTPISHVLKQVSYQYDERFPVFMGGPMMGFILPNLYAPITKATNCLLAPDHFEYEPPAAEQSCIRCSACSDTCPVHLMPQQLYWFARAEDHEKSEEYALKDCIECGLCAYVCPSHIPLIQYFRQEKAKIWEIKEKAQKAEEAKIRFEARQARLEKEEQERRARANKAAENRRAEMAQQKGIDPVQAALERLKAKKAAETHESNPEQKTQINIKGEVVPDNSDIMAQRKARRLARQQAILNSTEEPQNSLESAVENPEKNAEISAIQSDADPKKSAVGAAIARAKAKKLAQQTNSDTTSKLDNNAHSSEQNATESAVQSEVDPKKAAVAAAIARAKAKKLLAQQTNSDTAAKLDNNAQSSEQNATESAVQSEVDPKKAAVAAAIARAKAKQLAKKQAEIQDK